MGKHGSLVEGEKDSELGQRSSGIPALSSSSAKEAPERDIGVRPEYQKSKEAKLLKRSFL